MKTVREVTTRQPAIKCAACQTHSRPLFVPWHQHAVGCPVRAVDLQRRELEARVPLPSVSSLATF
jgi:hypothetical protein